MDKFPKLPEQNKLSSEAEKSLDSLDPKNSEKGIDQDKKRKDLGEMDESLAMMRDSEHYDKALVEHKKALLKRDSDIFQKTLQEEKGKFGGVKEDSEVKTGEVLEKTKVGQENKNPENQEINESKDEEINPFSFKPESESGNDTQSEKNNQNKPNNSEEFNPFSGKFGDTVESVFKGEEGQKETGKKHWGRRFGVKETGKNEKEPSEVEKLKQEADELFQKVLELKGDFQKTKEKRSLFNKAKAIFGISENEDGHINKECLDKKKVFKKAIEEYRAKYVDFSSKLVEEKRQNFRKEGKNEEEVENLVGKWILDGEAIPIKEKLEDGKEEEKIVSLFEHINKNEKEISKGRKEALSENKKGVLNKLSKWRQGLSPEEKFVLSCAISLSVGAGAGLAFGGGAAMIGTYLGLEKISKVVGGRILMSMGVGTAVGVVKKALDYDTMKVEKKSAEKRDEKFIESFSKNGGKDIFSILDTHRKTMKRKEKVNTGLLVASSAVAAYVIGSEFNEAWNDAHKSAIAPPPRPENFTMQPDPEDLKRSVGLENLHEKVEGKNSVLGDGKSVEDSAGLDKETFGNDKFELKPKGTVWGSLNEHFNGNRQEVGKVLADFKGRTVEDLIKNHGMDQIQANKFVEWRYRNLGEGTEFALNGEGKLEFPKFTNEEMIARFEQNLPEGGTKVTGVETVDLRDPQKIADLDKREIFKPIPREDLGLNNDASAETVEILDPEVSAKIDNQVDAIVNQKVQEIYKYWAGNQIEEWSTMKNKMAEDILNQNYGNSIGAQLDQVEVNNREELRNYLVQLTTEVDSTPRAGETVEQFIKRAERAKITGDFSENFGPVGNSSISGNSIRVEDLNDKGNFRENTPEALGNWGKMSSLEVLDNGDPQTRDYLRSLIKRANMIPGENQSLQDFARIAEDKIDGVRVPQTEMDYTLSKIFGRWTDAKIDQWMEMREYNASDLMRQGLNPRFTSVEMNNWREMSDHLNNLRSQYGNPIQGESVADYLERVGNENSTPKKFFTSGNLDRYGNRRRFRPGLR